MKLNSAVLQDMARASSVDDARQLTPAVVRSERGGKYSRRTWKARLGTWNVGSLTGRGMELVDCMKRRRIDILCIQETRWRGSGAKALGDDYKLLYSGGKEKKKGVGIIVGEDIKERIIEVSRKSDRLIMVKLLLEKKVVSVISGYAPQPGCSDEEKDEFWVDFEEIVLRVPDTESLVVGGDLNGHIGKKPRHV